MDKYDIIIVGGGLVGTALALALKNSPWRIALIEARDFQPLQQSLTDMRALALAQASQHILQKLGVWTAIEAAATPIRQIHVSQQGRFGTALLTAADLGFATFGHVVPLPVLFNTLQQMLSQSPITLLRPAHVTALQQQTTGWQLTVNEQTVTTTLLIAADGDHSWIRQAAGLPVQQKDYGQTAIATNVGISLPHAGTAFERFLTEGSIALLPLPQQRAGLVWVMAHETVKTLQALSDGDFLQAAQTAFGYRLGRLTALGRRQTHTLYEINAPQQTTAGLVLLGNAAHVMHPIAAQGLNLGLRDVEALAEALLSADDLADPELLEHYAAQRKQDQQQTLAFTDRLVQLFRRKRLPGSRLRALGLLTFDLLPKAKRLFAQRGMGLM